MDPRRKVLLADGGMGLVLAVYGLALADPSQLASAWWLPTTAAVVAVAWMYASEHLLVGVDATKQLGAYFLVFVLIIASLAALVAWTPLTLTPVLRFGFGGLGAGLVCYRLVYGVVLPVPSARLAGAERAV